MDNRNDTLNAGRVMLSLLHGSNYYSGSPHAIEYEAMLEQAVKEAQEKLAAYRRGKAASLALDALLPGWHDIDASNYLPREKWHTFISNDRVEWLAWLVEQGVSQENAEALVQSAFEED